MNMHACAYMHIQHVNSPSELQVSILGLQVREEVRAD